MRENDDAAAKALKPGDAHYTAYIGPPDQYDFMGGTQFALLFALGLRGHHKVLDFGCGSLRAGRLLIPYLDPGCYFGIEPNAWLIEDALDRQTGRDIVTIKRPVFSDSAAFDATVFGQRFNFILAQSIFSHAGPDVTALALAGFKQALDQTGLCAVTFIHGKGRAPRGWHYPGIVSYPPPHIEEAVSAAGLSGVPIPWHHPRQTWWLLAHEAQALPAPEEITHLRGVTISKTPEQLAIEYANGVPDDIHVPTLAEMFRRGGVKTKDEAARYMRDRASAKDNDLKS